MLAKFWGVRGSIPSPVGNQTSGKRSWPRFPEPERWTWRTLKRSGLCRFPAVAVISGTSGGNTPAWRSAPGTAHHFRRGLGPARTGAGSDEGGIRPGQGRGPSLHEPTHWDHIQGFPFFLPRRTCRQPHLHLQSQKGHSRKNSPPADRSGHVSGPAGRHGRDDGIRDHGGNAGVQLDGLTVRLFAVCPSGRLIAYRAGRKRHVADLRHGRGIPQAGRGQPPAVRRFLPGRGGRHHFRRLVCTPLPSPWTRKAGGNSTVAGRCGSAVKTGARRLILFHHEPTYSDEKLQELVDKTVSYYSLVRQDGHLDVLLAVEGMSLDI